MQPAPTRPVPILAGLTIVASICVWASASTPVFPTGAVTMRADITHDGAPPDGHGRRSSLSEDGSRIAFVSEATNLVPGDTNAVADVFVHDFDDGSTIRVSVASDGSQGDDASGSPMLIFENPVAISADGRSVAFESNATNLVADDTNGLIDVFVHDLETETTTRVSVASDGAEADGASRSISLSNDGRYVGYISFATTLVANAPSSGLYVHDRLTGETELASVAYDGSPVSAEMMASLSGNGRHVAFESSEPGIVPNDTNGEYDVFERNLNTGAIERVSVTSSGAQLTGTDPDEYSPNGPALSFNGRYVAFASNATNLPPPNDGADGTDVFVHDRLTGATVQADVSSLGWGGAESTQPVISDDGRFVGFYSGNHGLAPCGTNEHGTGGPGLYVRDMVAETTVRVTTYANGIAAYPGVISGTRLDLSSDGRVASFASDTPLDPNDVDEFANVYVHDVFAPVGAPDAAIGTNPAVGADRCQASPVFQSKGVGAAPRRTVSFTLTFRNLSSSPDALILRGDGGAPGFRVRYFKGQTDVTAALLAGTRRTRTLDWRESATYRLEVRVRSGAAPLDVIRLLIRASSVNQPAVIDVVRAKVTVSSED